MQHTRQNNQNVQPTQEGKIEGSVYVETRKLMYVLPQLGLIVNELLEKPIRKTRIYSKQDSASTLYTQMETHPIHPSCQRLWREIR